MYISDAAFKLWTTSDLIRVEELLTQDILHPLHSSHHAHALAQRSLLRTRLQRSEMAIDDAKRVNFSSYIVSHCVDYHTSVA